MVRVLSRHDADRLTPAAALAPRRPRLAAIGAALGTRRRRLVAGAIAFAYLAVYLWAIRHLVIIDRGLSGFVDVPSVQVVSDWRSRIFDEIAPFTWEPVVAIYPLGRVQILLAPLNVALGLLLGALVGVNTMLAVAAQRAGRACHRNVVAGVLGSLPGLLTGFACCVPTFALVLGVQATALLIGVRSWLFPAAVAAMLATLWWSAGRTARALAVSRPLVGFAPDAPQG